jgi:colanic acid/amylovoran biosynthesis glycosyltransferase
VRWLIVTDDFPPLDGGVATWTEAAARALVAAGDHVEVLARARPGLGAPGLVVRGVRGPSFGKHGSWWIAAASAPRLRGVDRVLATTWTVARRLVPLARRLGVPVDVVGHGSDLTRVAPGTPAARALVDVAGGVDRFFVVSAWLGARLEALGQRATVLASPVDVGAPKAPSEHPARWLYVARATPLKGGDRFVRLVAEAGVEGTVVGDGPERGAWESLASRVGARVRFVGRRPRAELPALYRAHDLVMLVPREDADGTGGEGLGLVLLEGAAHGVPGVGCRTGGVPEALGPGLLLDDPDDAVGSVEAIRRWWRPGLGSAARGFLAATHGTARLAAQLRDVTR